MPGEMKVGSIVFGPQQVTTNIPGPNTPVSARLYTEVEVAAREAAAELRGMERAAAICDRESRAARTRPGAVVASNCAAIIRAAMQEAGDAS